MMSICDIKMFAKAEESSFINNKLGKLAMINYCNDWQAACEEELTGEDEDNCLERFGKKKDASHCENLDRAEEKTEEPKFFYPLKNKYECLTDYHGKFDRVELDQEVHDCFNFYYMFAVEQCLE